HMSFNELGLSPSLLEAVSDTGYTIPTPIQRQAIPAVLEGRDVMAAAQTGTGKTAGFTLPILQRLAGKPKAAALTTRALILTPTRELAAQIQESIEVYGKHEQLRSVVVFGGVNIRPQIDALRRGCELLVATPGRLLDLHQQRALRFDAVEILVLDEADRMLDMGFIRDIRKVLALLPKKRQNLLFSATFSPEIRALAKGLCVDALEIDVAPRNSTVEAITQGVYRVDKGHKLPLLGKLLQETADQVLVFSRTKHGANNLVKKLAGYDVRAAAIHGNKSQNQRTKALADFKSGAVQVLVATDIAARGLDIDQLALVVNYDLPQVPEDYVHRIGRTGRAGATGMALSLVSEEDEKLLRDIERLIKRRIPLREVDLASLPERRATSETEQEDDEREVERSSSNGGRSRRGGGRPNASTGQPRQGQPRQQGAAQQSRPGNSRQGEARQGDAPRGQRRQGNAQQARGDQPRQGSEQNTRQGQPGRQGNGQGSRRGRSGQPDSNESQPQWLSEMQQNARRGRRPHAGQDKSQPGQSRHRGGKPQGNNAPRHGNAQGQTHQQQQARASHHDQGGLWQSLRDGLGNMFNK
ncbi:MAG TPA: DEAD/DEAH box helicase, partial [Hyphomicrobiales bacterium]|nr:DEAD/DEAH box helicase [Hyphomicrobiales bacterium]